MDTATSSLDVIDTLVRQIIFEETITSLVIPASRKGKAVCRTMIMRQRNTAVVVPRGIAQLQICSLIMEGIPGMHTHQTSHRIATIQRALRTT